VGKKKSVPDVPAKVKIAIAVLLEQPKEDLHAAALAAGLTTYRLREALKRSFVRSYLFAEKQALLDAVSAGNPLALKQVRDTSDNGMAVVAGRARNRTHAAGRSGDCRQRHAAPPNSAGLIVIIESAGGRTEQVIGAPAMPMIEARPEPQLCPTSDDR